MNEPTKKFIAETHEWRAYLVGENVEIEGKDRQWVIPTKDVPDFYWLLDKVNAYLSLSAWEKR